MFFLAATSSVLLATTPSSVCLTVSFVSSCQGCISFFLFATASVSFKFSWSPEVIPVRHRDLESLAFFWSRLVSRVFLQLPDLSFLACLFICLPSLSVSLARYESCGVCTPGMYAHQLTLFLCFSLVIVYPVFLLSFLRET